MSNGQHANEQAKPADAGFKPPRHWVGVEELDPAYWANAEIQEKRGQEFYEKPLEWLEKMDKTGAVQFARREFLTVMSASMAMAGLSCARRPVHKIIPYVVKPEEITPGVATYYASTSKDCSCGCGLLVKTREGRPIKLEGNPDHPVNRGALCGTAQASVLSLYDTDRLRGPVARAKGEKSPRTVTWQEADTAIMAALAKAGSGKVRVLTPQLRGFSTPKLIKEFLSAKGGKHVEFEPIGLEEISGAQEKSYGRAVTPAYHFDKADVIVSIGADFAGHWLSPVAHSRDFAKSRKLTGKNSKNAKMNKLFVFEPNMTVTGSSADERTPIRPGDEHKIALAIAHEIVVVHKAGQYAGDSSVTLALASYKPEAVAADIGLTDAQPIKRAAAALLKARGAGLVVAGGIASRAGNEIPTQLAVNFLNSALANEGVTVDGTANVGAPLAGASSLTALVDEMNKGAVDVLFVYRSNPAYSSVAGFAEAAKKVAMVVSITERDDETGLASDFVLPDHHGLESWGDASPYADLYSLQQPTIAPLHDSRAFEDSLITWASILQKAPNWHEYLKTNWRDSLYKASGAAASFEDFWEGCLRRGVFDARAARGGSAKPSARGFRTASLSAIPALKTGAAGDLVLALYPSIALGDGRHANNAWLQEMPDPVSSVTWDNYLAIAPASAKKLGYKNDDVAEVQASGYSVKLPVRIQPGMHPGVVAAAVGYGQTRAGKVGNGVGRDVYRFVQKTQFSGHAVKLRRTQELYRLAATQWYNEAMERPIINDISLAEYRENPAAAREVEPELRLEKVPTLWPRHKYEGHRWGMAIDLNACTGCGACTIACQAENNVPVVGREQVRNNRHMGWIRIDRYFEGSPENPNVVFQPMLCQHCENAPCETVCPVVATVHDDEGLNVQVYNRCVGTRYCQNNCPYKVRRFNFFDHWAKNPSGDPEIYKGTMNLVWNPDVTVRTRGIMEKCTFCVQRIREAKDEAKDLGIPVADGSFKVACEQTCSTDAIVFGDLNDPDSRVSKLRNDPRNYRVLETNNTGPAVSYLTRVRYAEALPPTGSNPSGGGFENKEGGAPARKKEHGHG